MAESASLVAARQLAQEARDRRRAEPVRRRRPVPPPADAGARGVSPGR